MTDVVYLDYAASTPIDPRVVEAMGPCHGVANPASAHVSGQEAAVAVESGRREVASLIAARDDEIVFTSGATEADNLAIGGAIRAAGGGHVVTSAAEHKAVLEASRAFGASATVLPVDRQGRVGVNEIAESIREDTVLVSIMLVNNEIGTISAVQDIADVCRDSDVLLHCDAAQACGKISVDVEAIGADLLSISAHKMYGPKGIGALWVRRGVRDRLAPIMYGGGHEQGLRPGTLNPAACAGFGAAAAIAAEEMTLDHRRAAELRSAAVDALRGAFEDVRFNGDSESALPGILNIRIPGVDADSLLLAAPEVAASTGSACTSATPAPSHVLQAIGLTHEQAGECLRLSFGRFSTRSEIEFAVSVLAERAPLVAETGALVE